MRRGTKYSKILFYHCFFFLIELLILSPVIVSREYFFEVRIPCEIGFTIPESKYCRARISSYSWEFHKEGFLSREYSTIFISDFSCSFQDVSRSGVVSESLIIGEKFLIARIRETLESRKPFEDPRKISSYSFDLCLLEEDL